MYYLKLKILYYFNDVYDVNYYYKKIDILFL